MLQKIDLTLLKEGSYQALSNVIVLNQFKKNVTGMVMELLPPPIKNYGAKFCKLISRTMIHRTSK